MTQVAKSRFMAEMHETAHDLYEAGVIDKLKMTKFDLLCLKPVETYDAEKIKSLRSRLEISQSFSKRGQTPY